MSNSILALIILACAIISALSVYGIARNNQAEKETEKRLNATSGILNPEIVINGGQIQKIEANPYVEIQPDSVKDDVSNFNMNTHQEDRYELWVGSVGGGWTREDLESEFPIMRLLSIQGKAPISVRLFNGKFVVEGRFVDLENKLVAELKDGEWVHNPGATWKRNYDDNAFEVLDNSGMIVLQVYFQDTKTIRLEGVIVTPQYVLVATNDGLRTIPNLNGLVREQEAFWGRNKMDWKDFVREKAEAIKPIFIYTGENWLGKRRSIKES